ncbi:hypothetical protein QTP88_026382 [Uroleucon formosanum]
MGHVDALSRCHNILILEANTFEQLLAIKQRIDESIVKIRNNIQVRSDKKLELREGLVYRKEKDKLLFYVPQTMEDNVIRCCHDDLAHVGAEKVIENVRRIYWFPEMKLKVRNYVFNCLKCIEYSPIAGKRQGYLHSIPKGNRPFLTVHVDHLGPLEKTKNYNKFILVVIDSFSKFVRCYPSKTTKTEEVVSHLKGYFCSYSKLKRLISDRGTAFTSNDFKIFLASESIEHVLIATGTPRANGQVEVVNRSIVPMLAKVTEPNDEWDRGMYKVEFAINNTVHRSTRQTTSRLLFGINQVGDVSDELRHMLEEINENRFDLLEIRGKASKQIIKTQTKSEEYYNDSHKEPVKYNIGDYVMIRKVDVTLGVNKKLIHKFKGPYVVRKVLDHDRYVVGDIKCNQVTQRSYEGIIGPDQMKSWACMSSTGVDGWRCLINTLYGFNGLGNNATTIKFLELYEAESAIWDAKDKNHKLKHKVHDAWKRISLDMNNIPIEELKAKKKSLMATFRSLLKKKKASIRSGAGADDVFQPIWFAYDIMERFLGTNFEVVETINTEDEKEDEDECDVYAKLLAKKLRKYPERMRDQLMYKIDGFLLDNPYPDEQPSSAYSYYSSTPSPHYQNSTPSPASDVSHVNMLGNESQHTPVELSMPLSRNVSQGVMEPTNLIENAYLNAVTKYY